MSATIPTPVPAATATPPQPIRLALVCDYREEHWPSMDLVGEMVLTHLQAGHADAIAPTRICPPFRPVPPGCRGSAGAASPATPTACSTGSGTTPDGSPGSSAPGRSTSTTWSITATASSSTICRPAARS